MRIIKTVLWKINFGNTVLWRKNSTKIADVRFEIWNPVLNRRNQSNDKKIEDIK